MKKNESLGSCINPYIMIKSQRLQNCTLENGKKSAFEMCPITFFWWTLVLLTPFILQFASLSWLSQLNFRWQQRKENHFDRTEKNWKKTLLFHFSDFCDKIESMGLNYIHPEALMSSYDKHMKLKKNFQTSESFCVDRSIWKSIRIYIFAINYIFRCFSH